MKYPGEGRSQPPGFGVQHSRCDLPRAWALISQTRFLGVQIADDNDRHYKVVVSMAVSSISNSVIEPSVQVSAEMTLSEEVPGVHGPQHPGNIHSSPSDKL